jgi:hypothetical protein
MKEAQYQDQRLMLISLEYDQTQTRGSEIRKAGKKESGLSEDSLLFIYNFKFTIEFSTLQTL